MLIIIATSTYYSDSHLQYILNSQYPLPRDYSIRVVSQLRRGAGRGTDQYVYSFLFVINWISQACQQSQQHQRVNDSLLNTQIGSFMTVMEPLLKLSVEDNDASCSTVGNGFPRLSAVVMPTSSRRQQQKAISSEWRAVEPPFASSFTFYDNSFVMPYLPQEHNFYQSNQAFPETFGSSRLTTTPPTTFQGVVWGSEGMLIPTPRAPNDNDNTASYIPDISCTLEMP